MKLVGANANAAVTGAEELPGKSNYFIGNDPKKWRTNVPTYAKVRYQNVYPGVDLVYYGNQGGELEYDFVVAPGADPGSIPLALDAGGGVGSKQKAVGSHQYRIDPNGDLVVRVDGDDEIRFHKPLVYQGQDSGFGIQGSGAKDPQQGATSNRKSPIANRKSVDACFRLDAENRIHFALGPYDHTRPLVIDPVLSYSTYLGGSSYDGGGGIAVDSAGNAYVAGSTGSTDFPTVNPLQPNYGGGEYDAFVAKLNPAGSALVYSTYLGGSGLDGASGIAVDAAGNAYVTGSTRSTDFPTVNPLQAKCGDCSHYSGTAFVAKLNASGSALVYSTYLGGTNGASGDVGNAIAVDSSGNAYVSGQTSSKDFPTVNPFQASLKGSQNAFVSKLNSTGSALVYSSYLGGSHGDSAEGIAVDSDGNAYLAGSTNSTDFPTVNPFQATNKANPAIGENTAFVAKLNSSGSALVYSTYLGGSNSDQGSGIAVDSSGDAYVTGSTNSSDFPTVNPLQASLNLGQYSVCVPAFSIVCDDAFVAELNPSGSALVYTTYLGGTSGDYGLGITVDAAGDAYVTGSTGSTDFPTANPVQATNKAAIATAGQTAFVAELNATGSALVYSTYVGGSIQDGAGGVAVDSSSNVYITGATYSSDFPTVNPLQANKKSATSSISTAFVAKLSPGPAPAVSFSTPALNFASGSTTSPPQGVTVTNLGNAPLSITGISASGDFALVTTATSCPYGGGTVAAEAHCTIDVTFTPTATGARTGTVTVADNASGSPQTLQLTGTGILPALDVSPLSLTFTNQLVGTTSGPQTVTVTNTASVAIGITSLTIPSAWTQSNNCLPSVAPNTSCTINVSFQPTAGGNFQSGILTLTDNASNSPQLVDLNGTGVYSTNGPNPSFSLSGVNFQSQLVGTASYPYPITVQNTGNQALIITNISLTGADSGDFSLSQNCPSALAVNASCQINVTFTPTAAGTRTAGVTLFDNATVSPQSIPVYGIGLGPGANLSPGSLTFPGQFVGTTGLPENITLTNNGNAPLNISSIQASAQFGASNGCTTSLAAGVGCTISVFFDPSSAGSQTGTLTITDNAPGSPQTVQLSGTGMDFAMSSSAPSATVAAGQQATYALTVTPQGGLNQTVNLTCSGAPSLSTCTATPGSVTLNGTTAAQVSVAVSTTAGTWAPPWERVVPPSPKGLGAMFWLYALLGLASLAGLAGAGRRRAAYLLGACLLMVMLWSACGGGAQVVHTPGTPPGTYTLDVTATVTSAATSSTLTHVFKFTLTVD